MPDGKPGFPTMPAHVPEMGPVHTIEELSRILAG